MLTVSKPVLKAQRPWYPRLKLEYHESLSNFAFKINLRRYIGTSMKSSAFGFLLASLHFPEYLVAGAYTHPLLHSSTFQLNLSHS